MKHALNRGQAHFKLRLGHTTLLWPEGSQKSNPSELLVQLKNENVRNEKKIKGCKQTKNHREIFNVEVQFYFTLSSIAQHRA